jgi:putative endonuclease
VLIVKQIYLLMAQHNVTGNTGEALAINYFIGLGYTILHQNWRHSHWEVDIIATKQNVLHFIEVKTRKTKKFGLPEESVSKKKIQNIINASEEYLYQYPQWKRIQFDVLAITILKNEPVEYFLIEDVYL